MVVTKYPATFVGLQHVFSVTIFLLARRLEHALEDEKWLRWRRLHDVFKTCFQDVFKTCLQEVLKICLQDVFKTSWRQTKCLLGISLSDKSKPVSSKSVSHKSISSESMANPKCINYNPKISKFVLFWNSSKISILRIKISDDCSVLRKQLS